MTSERERAMRDVLRLFVERIPEGATREMAVEAYRHIAVEEREKVLKALGVLDGNLMCKCAEVERILKG